ncbi:hypothetical protein LEP1GSC021_3149 [Leptospira noguchii str. 1993005606]|nr:hypothetical protein LEP1GSC021_3149 [Leptospira noguchii str. 1993005606]
MSISQVNNYESKVQTVLRPALSKLLHFWSLKNHVLFVKIQRSNFKSEIILKILFNSDTNSIHYNFKI